MFAFFAVLLAITFVPSIFVVHYHSYKTGYSNGRSDEEMYQNFDRRKSILDELHGESQ
jgi:hypothetical protein